MMAKAKQQAGSGNGFSRRQVSALGVALPTAWLPGASLAAANVVSKGAEAVLAEKMVRIATPDGTADAFFVRPADGAHPAVVMWPDVAGLREASRDAGRALARKGYAVLVVNSYYRTGAEAPFASIAQTRTRTGSAKLAGLLKSVDAHATNRDAKAFAAWLARQDGVSSAELQLRSIAAEPTALGRALADRSRGPLAGSHSSYLFAVSKKGTRKDAAAFREVARAVHRQAMVETLAA